MNVIFLDIDGVLNGYNPRVDLFWSVLRKLHIKNIICRFYDRMGIRFFKLILLKILIKKNKCKNSFIKFIKKTMDITIWTMWEYN